MANITLAGSQHGYQGIMWLLTLVAKRDSQCKWTIEQFAKYVMVLAVFHVEHAGMANGLSPARLVAAGAMLTKQFAVIAMVQVNRNHPAARPVETTCPALNAL